MLVEEEKFRKSGKKKYEQLSEKMLQLYTKLNSLTSGTHAATGASVPHIDVRPTLAALSAKGKGLLKGRFKERIELMHLQLSTGPTTSAHVPSPVGAISTPAAAPLASRLPGPKKSGGMYTAHPPTPPNVFDFSQNKTEGVTRNHSGDALGSSAAEKGIAVTGRASGDSVVSEKENVGV